MNLNKKYVEKTYAGVLGKMIGVYLGRPVEGWQYKEIKERFGEVKYYVHDKLGLPLIVADDDLSGTFGFYKAMEDNNLSAEITAKQVGEAWLNYLIEDKTILWWGGPGRSTGNTVYLNLKNGIPAPQSGSIAVNGQTVAEQIGAQIFMDAFAMTAPANPDLAVELVRRSASVAYDGKSLEAAGYLAAMESMAYEERRLGVLFDEADRYLNSDHMKKLNYFVRNLCEKERNWRKVRERIDEQYGYDKFHGTCHVVPNHAIILASLLLGGDDFQKALSIAVSCAWDTDCNAANIGCINGIRLGLEGINAGVDFRGPMADQLFVVTADGGSVVSDAVLETRNILRASARIRGETISLSTERFAFEQTGSVQGFTVCPYNEDLYQPVSVSNANEYGNENGLRLSCNHLADGVRAEVSTPVFIDFVRLCNNYSTVASPTLYETQTVKAILKCCQKQEIQAALYALYYDAGNQVCRVDSPKQILKKGDTTLEWKIPKVNGMPYFRLGVCLISKKRFDGEITVSSIDWKGAPEDYNQQGKLFQSIFNVHPNWTKAWTSSASNFEADNRYTFSMSHKADNGLATIGTQDWMNYSIASSIEFSLNKRGGMVLRSKGHRRYYGACLSECKEAVIFIRKNEEEIILGKTQFLYQMNDKYEMRFECVSNRLRLYVDGTLLLETEDTNDTYKRGGAGFFVDRGSILIDGVRIQEYK